MEREFVEKKKKKRREEKGTARIMALMGTVDYTPFEFIMLFAVFGLGFLCFFQMYYVYPALVLFVAVAAKLLLKGYSGPKDKYSHKVCGS